MHIAVFYTDLVTCIYAQILAKQHSRMLVGCLLWILLAKLHAWQPNAASSLLISCASAYAQQMHMHIHMDLHHDSQVGTPCCLHVDTYPLFTRFCLQVSASFIHHAGGSELT